MAAPRSVWPCEGRHTDHIMRALCASAGRYGLGTSTATGHGTARPAQCWGMGQYDRHSGGEWGSTTSAVAGNGTVRPARWWVMGQCDQYGSGEFRLPCRMTFACWPCSELVLCPDRGLLGFLAIFTLVFGILGTSWRGGVGWSVIAISLGTTGEASAGGRLC